MGVDSLEALFDFSRSSEKEKMPEGEIMQLPWIGSLSTVLGDETIVREIPMELRSNITLDALYNLLRSGAGQSPEENKVLSDIGAMIKQPKGIHIDINGNSAPCEINKITGQVAPKPGINLKLRGKLGRLKENPDKQVIVYDVQIAEGTIQGAYRTGTPWYV